MLNKSLSAFLVLLLSGLAATAQIPTSDQLNALKNMPKDQQDALIQSVLGTGKSDGTGSKTDSKLSTPESVRPKSDLSKEELDKLNKRKSSDDRILRQSDEDPELRAEDTILIDLTPIDRYRDRNTNFLNDPNASGNDSGTNGINGVIGANDVNDVNGVDGSAAND